MFLIVNDPDRGVVAAPESLEDLDGPTVDLLQSRGFQWDDGEEMFAAQASEGAETEDLALDVIISLALLGHVVLMHNA